MRMVEPIPGLRIYFEDYHKGAYQLDVFDRLRKKEIKMTREEAKLKLERTVNRGFDRVNADIMIESLEALGLIKFDEEEKQMKCEDIGGKMWIVKLDSAIQSLRGLGYSVEKLPLNGR